MILVPTDSINSYKLLTYNTVFNLCFFSDFILRENLFYIIYKNYDKKKIIFIFVLKSSKSMYYSEILNFWTIIREKFSCEKLKRNIHFMMI